MPSPEEQAELEQSLQEDWLRHLKLFHAQRAKEGYAHLQSAAMKASKLYAELKPKLPAMLVKNRGVAPDDPEFFLHAHALEAFLRAIEFPIDESRLAAARAK